MKLLFVLLVFLLLITNAQANINSTFSELSQSEWQSIQTQITKNQYQPQKNTDGSYQAINHQHGFRIVYGQDGTTLLEPHKTSDFHISMRLNSINGEEVSKMPALTTTENNKLNYHWNDNIEERWVNSEQQLEQWFTIQKKPTRQHLNDALVLVMKIDTNLQIDQKDNVLTFSGYGKNITYDKLKVWDVNDQIIPAKMQLKGNLLSLQIKDQSAIYPLIIDPIFTQEAYIKASNTGAYDTFGYSVAVDKDTLVVGAHHEDSSKTGITDNEDADNNAVNSGAVYVFVRDENDAWSQQAYIKASNTGADDFFGWSVAINKDTLVVGAPYEASGETGTSGTGNSNSAQSSGAVYVFVRDENDAWSQQAYIKASNTDAVDLFGHSIALNDNSLAIGAIREDSNTMGINGDQTNNDFSMSGAVYIFTRDNNTWNQQAYIKASNTNEFDQFGWSVALDGNTLAVSANQEDSNAIGTGGGGQANNDLNNSGAVYVFTREDDAWSQQAYIKASNTGFNDMFGYSIALDGNTLTVGSPREDSGAQGINGNQENDNVPNSGAVYVFTREGDTWSQQAYIKTSISGIGDWFGSSLDLSGNTLVVGARSEDSDTQGINGDQENDNALNSGAVYVFTRENDTWSQQAYIKASNTNTDDFFGQSVALDGDTLLVGADVEDSNAVGINDAQNNNDATNAGASYVFSITNNLIFIDGFE